MLVLPDKPLLSAVKMSSAWTNRKLYPRIKTATTWSEMRINDAVTNGQSASFVSRWIYNEAQYCECLFLPHNHQRLIQKDWISWPLLSWWNTYSVVLASKINIRYHCHFFFISTLSTFCIVMPCDIFVRFNESNVPIFSHYLTPLYSTR